MPTWIAGFLFSIPFVVGMPLAGFILVQWMGYTIKKHKERRKSN